MTTETVRKELLKMHDNERQSMRCELAQELKNEANEQTKEIDTEIENCDKKAIDLKDRIKTIESKVMRLKTERTKLLDNAKLHNMSGYACAITELHTTLIEFDKETNTIRKDILTMK